MKLRLSMLAMIASGGMIAGSVASASPTKEPSLSALRHSLLTSADFPKRWTVRAPISGSNVPYPCTGLRSVEQMLGRSAVGIAFTQPSERSLAFEYLAYRTDIVAAFENATSPIMTFASCHDSKNGHVVDASVSDGTIVTQTFGDWSLLWRDTNVVHGTKYQVGYMFVREGRSLMVIGYENEGPLNVKALEHLTREALAKIAAK